MNKTIWFARHGQSAANAGLNAADESASISLTEKGARQARLFADFFPEKPALVVHSPFARVAQTARPLVERFAPVETQERPVHEFVYLGGAARARIADAPHEKQNLIDEFWTRADVDFCGGADCESFAAFIGRVRAEVENLKNAAHDAIVCFTHRQFIRAAMWLFLTDKTEINTKINSAAMREFYHFMRAVAIPNTGFIKLEFSKNEAFLSPISTAHLDSSLISF